MAPAAHAAGSFCYSLAMIREAGTRRAASRPLLSFLDRSFPGPSPRSLAGLRWMFLDAVTASGSGTYYEYFFVLFALAAGVAAERIRLLVGAGGLASVLAYLPGASLTARLRTRKPFIMLTSGGVARPVILGLAVLPTLGAGGSAVSWAILGMRFTTALMGSVATPAGTTLAVDVVPQQIRGRYFATRNAAVSVAAAGASAVAGWAVRGLNVVSADGIGGHRFAFAFAFAGGMLATAFFSRIPELPERRPAGPARRARDVLSIARRSPAFAWLAVSSELWGLALYTAAPLYNVYLVTELGGSAAVVGTSSALMGLAGLLGLVVFGRTADRRGNRRVLAVAGLLLPLVPLLRAPVRTAWETVLISLPSGFLLAGYNLAGYNLLLEMSPPEDRKAGVAVYQTLVAISTVVAPLLGSWLAAQLGYIAMFAVTSAARLASLLIFIALARPRR